MNFSNLLEMPDAQVKLNENDFQKLSEIIHSLSGIELKPHKMGLLKNRLIGRLRANSLENFSDYLDFIEAPSGRGEWEELLNCISTNVTSFFREKQHFDFLSQEVIPELEHEKKRERCPKIRVWSSACSSGEEPLSLAMTFGEKFKSFNQFDFKILGTDISSAILKQAIRGEYPQKKIQSVPKNYVEKYFQIIKSESENIYRAKSFIARNILYRRMNLMAPSWPFENPLDIIFCRNVMIYFNKKTQKELLEKFYRNLKPGGYLFLGHSEGLNGISSDFKYVTPSVYRKL